MVITGMGIVSPVGNSIKEAWDNILNGKSGIGPISTFDVSDFSTRFGGEVKDFDAKQYIAPKDIKKMDPFIHYGMAAGIQAIEDSGLEYHEWVVRQEDGEKPKIHFYIEAKNGVVIDADQAAVALSEYLRDRDPFYGILEDTRDVMIEVTVLPSGAFRSFTAKQRAAGADLAHLKPPHINPPDDMVESLLAPDLLSEQNTAESARV